MIRTNLRKNKPKKCKNCGELFTPSFSTLQVCCSPKCAIELAKKKEHEKYEKGMKVKIKEMDVRSNASKHKGTLQREINKLARAIDSRYGYKCIDCGSSYGKQADGAHYHPVGSHENVRFNLHNIHKSTSHCNQFSSEHKPGYIIGLKERYGEDYYERVEGLSLEFKEMHFSNQQIYDAIPIVRRLNRTVDTYVFTSAIRARDMFNKIIGLYA